MHLKRKENVPHKYLIVIALLLIVVMGVVLFFSEGSNEVTGSAVLKGVGSKSQTKNFQLNDKKIPSSLSAVPLPVKSAPQPGPPPRDSEDQGTSDQCETCGKEFEYKSGVFHCNNYEPVYAEWGIDGSCGNQYAGADMTAWCMYDASVVSYGAKCPEGTSIQKLAPPYYALQSGEGWAEDPTTWHSEPPIRTIELECSEEGGNKMIYLTCMREKSRD